MTNETNPGTVEASALWSRLLDAASLGPCALLNCPNCQKAIDLLTQALAAQSQPAATAQEVGDLVPRIHAAINRETINLPLKANTATIETLRRCLVALEQPTRMQEDAVAEVVNAFSPNDWGIILVADEPLPVGTKLYVSPSKAAEPAAKAGDAEPKPVAMVRVTNKGYGMSLAKHVIYVLPEGDHWLYAAPPSPHPDMGSDEAVEAVAAIIANNPGMRSIPLAQAIIAALSSPASQSVEKMTEAAFRAGYTTAALVGGDSLEEAWKTYAALPHKEEATPAPVGERIEVQIDDNPAGLPRAYDPEPEEWDGPLTAEEQAKIDAAWEKHKAADPVCRIPPEGWSCSRVAGHDGPCAATPATTERGRG